jgi:hypothetical protein
MLRHVVRAPRFRHQMRPQRAGGFSMIEFSLVLAISAIILTKQFSDIIAAVDEGNSIATAKYLEKLQGGVNNYWNENDVALKTPSNTITGFVDPLKPTINELIAKGYLELGFSVRSPLGLTFQNAFVRTGTCPGGSDCKVGGFAYSTAGYRDGEGRVRTDILTTAVSKIGPDAGMSLAETPSLLTAMGGGTVANPAGAVAGTLAIRIGAGSGLLPLLSQYYKLDGSKSLAGAMNANNNDINQVRNLLVTATTSTADLAVQGDTKMAATGVPGVACTTDTAVRRNVSGAGLVICSSGAWQLVGNAVAGIADGAACSSPGQLGSSSTGISFVCNGSYWTTLNVTANAGDSCAPAGKTATSILNREQLVCKNGTFVRLVNLIAKNIEVSRVLVTDTSVINKPNCDTGGTAAYSFQMSQTVVDVSVVPPRQAMYIAAIDNGPSWSVKIKLKDNSGGEFSANAYSISAVMKLECAY